MGKAGRSEGSEEDFFYQIKIKRVITNTKEPSQRTALRFNAITKLICFSLKNIAIR